MAPSELMETSPKLPSQPDHFAILAGTSGRNIFSFLHTFNSWQQSADWLAVCFSHFEVLCGTHPSNGPLCPSCCAFCVA